MNTERPILRLGPAAAGLLALFALVAGCRLYNLEKNLKPADAEFISTVRYIITGEERKIFLESADTDKPKLIEEFWKRRDPDPDTEENEFKIEYLNRLARANELFHGEGKAGWLTDRGRIFILFGPPLDRIVNPPSLGSRIERCSEVWYYGQFPVVFADYSCNGNYQLVTYDLTPIREMNMAYMSALSEAQNQAQTTFRQEKSLFIFDWDVQKKTVAPDLVEGLVTVEVPVANIWFKAVDDKMETVLEIQLELLDSEGKVYWEHKESLPVLTSESELKAKAKDRIRREIPFSFDKDLDRLRRGKNQFNIRIKNTTGDETLRKTTSFSL
ncbi:MAG: GWxTD domain-containing protein [Candidatus Aminicenantes bacterium]|nr:GWxTD domain-containing protein [Candidatus Aminicenantes bacterium]